MEEPIPMTHPVATRLSLQALNRVTRLAPLALAALMAACATAPGPQGVATPPVAAAPQATAPVAPPATPVAPQVAVQPRAKAPPAPAANTIAIDPLSPTELLDLGAPDSRTDLWARVRLGLAVPDMQNERVEKWQQWYASRPEYVQRMTERGGRYLFHIVEEVNKRDLPTELALLPFIESAFNPQAMSSAKASGMWQFIPGTGRDFDLRQNLFRDDRRDVLASTRAALDYLQMLHRMFGDWQLALAAYNWGQGSVQKAIARNQQAGLPIDYDSLRMPDETRNYYPKLQAVKNIVANPESFGLSLPELKNHPYFVSVGIDRDIDIDIAARLAGLPMDEFKQLNPQMNKPVILAAGTPQLLLPYDNANRFVRAVAQHRGNLASWTAWVANRTVKPAEAARQVGMDEAQLRAVNNIPKGMLVKAGSTLLVPRSMNRTEDVAEHIADHATLALAPDVPPLKRVSFKAGRKGDTVVAIARRYRVRPEQVAQWNSTSAGARFKPGQVVVVMVPNKPATRLAGKRSPVRSAKAGAAKRLSKPTATARKPR
jgi:membrane-bound lytic murein transglycosylase D